MDGLLEDVRNVSGLFFQMVYENEVPSGEWSNFYLLSLKENTKKGNIFALIKFIRMFAIPYRIVLLEKENKESIGILIYCEKDDLDELDSTMEWVVKCHPEWEVLHCRDGDGYMPKIVGYRIANNMFHERKLRLQGELLS